MADVTRTMGPNTHHSRTPPWLKNGAARARTSVTTAVLPIIHWTDRDLDHVCRAPNAMVVVTGAVGDAGGGCTRFQSTSSHGNRIIGACPLPVCQSLALT